MQIAGVQACVYIEMELNVSDQLDTFSLSATYLLENNHANHDRHTAKTVLATVVHLSWVGTLPPEPGSDFQQRFSSQHGQGQISAGETGRSYCYQSCSRKTYQCQREGKTPSYREASRRVIGQASGKGERQRDLSEVSPHYHRRIAEPGCPTLTFWSSASFKSFRCLFHCFLKAKD